MCYDSEEESDPGPVYQGEAMGIQTFQTAVRRPAVMKGANYPGYGYTADFPVDLGTLDEAVIYAFKIIDTNNSGRLSRSEMFATFCNPNGSQFTRETIVLLCGMFDSDSSGGLDLHDFAQLYFFMEEWLSLWEKYDTERKGWMNADEMHRALVDLGYKYIEQSVVASLVRKLGKTGKKLYPDAFIRICSVCKRVTDNFRKKDKRHDGKLRMNYNDFLKLSLRSCF
ncbi:peflin-like [Tropilaelaps mercedesae]|uniref:Peflin n=1 Tax=Tropilaelaps mercedesae TaxID=418985 RepID=A0A1V9X193_9ACAR|nr:peflin-like [Tropilaelaps mercedesae]